MKIIQTDSFELAVYKKGNDDCDKLALVLPGQLDTKDYPHMRSHVDFLANKGFLALSFDPPGTWESSDDINLYTLTNYIKAINELIKYFDNKPTILVGHSRGGSMAMLVGARNSNVTHFADVMGRATPSTLNPDAEIEDGCKISYRDLPSDSEKQRKYKLPLNFFDDASKYNSLDDLSRSDKFKLFIYGKDDTTVLPEYVKLAYDTSSDPKTIVELDSDHNYRWHPHLIEEVNKIIGNFLDSK